MKNINKYNLIKWYKMLTGRSILHVNQGLGKIYSKTDIRGYYNDLTEKVTKDKNVDALNIPKFKIENGAEVIFPIAVFQYGLGAYDLYLLKGEVCFLEKFKLMADWTLNNQEEKGSWNNFFYIYPDAPYSAMAQGEGISLLVRAYIHYSDSRYLDAAKKAVEFMLTPVESGGTTLYKNNDIFLQEVTNKSTILNGWIFALFGLYDFIKLEGKEQSQLVNVFNRSLNTLKKHLYCFDNGYWSLYNIDGSIITSQFYHKLHIAQIFALYDLFDIKEFQQYYNKWKRYQDNWINRNRAFILKAYQKLTE